MDQDPALVHLETETETPSGTQQTEDVPKVVLHFYLNCHVGPGPVLSSVPGVPRCSIFIICYVWLVWPGLEQPSKEYTCQLGNTAVSVFSGLNQGET